MITEERIIKLLKQGCPKCSIKDRFAIDSMEYVRRDIWQAGTSDIDYGEAEYIETVSLDYILCRACWWQEPGEGILEREILG